MSCYYRTPQKTLPIAVVTKNAAIDLIYIGGSKTCRNRQHVAAVFAPDAIARFSCSEVFTFKTLYSSAHILYCCLFIFLVDNVP